MVQFQGEKEKVTEEKKMVLENGSIDISIRFFGFMGFLVRENKRMREKKKDEKNGEPKSKGNDRMSEAVGCRDKGQLQ